ncbi:hypothetical protein KAI58_04615 [Candidatus Gracilibacteria bacterium]|nr:hypothetical protein [Candidatus Gracilibacteria bacterium]
MSDPVENNVSFIQHLENEGVVLGDENDYETVMKAMESFHVNSSVGNILSAFDTLKSAKKEGKVFVRKYLNGGVEDIKLSIENVPSGSLIDGVSGQPTNHVS